MKKVGMLAIFIVAFVATLPEDSDFLCKNVERCLSVWRHTATRNLKGC